MKYVFSFIGLVTAMTTASLALAEEAPPEVEGVGEDTSTNYADDSTESSEGDAATAGAAEPAPAAEEAPDDSPAQSGDHPDGARFRFGVGAGLGGMFFDGGTFTYTGLDLRFGVQINDLIAVYAQPQLGAYFGDTSFGLGTGGLVGASALIDFTFIDRMFVGAGVGYAVLNNPSGLELHLRAGGYPIMSKSTDKARRKGLSVGLDFRVHLLDGLTVVAPTANIGYDAF